jgi:hypothetical protein
MSKAAKRATADQVKEAINQILATGSVSREVIKDCAQNSGLDAVNPKYLTKALMSVGRELRESGRLGRLGAMTLLGLALLGNDLLKSLERAKLLLSDIESAQKIAKFLGDFDRRLATRGDEWGLLRLRLATYRAYAALQRATADRFERVILEAGIPLRHWAPQLLALTELCFLNAYFETSVSKQHESWFQALESPEDLAEAVSTVFAIANHRRELDALDFSYPAMDDLVDPFLFELLQAGHAVNHVRDVEKHISLFQYCLRIEAGKGITTWILSAPSPEFELTLRLGYIRAEVGREKAPLDLSQGMNQTILTLPGMAERFVGTMGKGIAEIRDAGTKFRRLRIRMPLDPDIQRIIDSFAYYEDQWEQESLSQDFVFPLQLKGTEELRLTGNLTVKEFLRAYRLLRFYAFVNLAALRPYASSDRTVFINSLVRIASQEPLLELLGQVGGLSRQAGIDLLELVSADSSSLGYYDLQYKPFFKFGRVFLLNRPDPPHEYAYGCFLMTMSNMIRNVRVANKMRFQDDGKIFVMAVAALLQKRFDRVVTERNLQAGTLHTDVDVAVLEGDTLFLFECKHSLPSTGMHETRDLWEDIEDGVNQLSIARAILQDKGRMTDFLAGWFPRVNRKRVQSLKIRYCVLSSHRLFSGLQEGEIAMRDFASLSRLLGDGVVGMGLATADGVLMSEFSLWRSETFTVEDLACYLSPNSVFHRSFDPFLVPFVRLHRFGEVVIALETFIHTSSLEEWNERMSALGCRRLPDRLVKLKFPEKLGELRAKIEALGKNGERESASV